jgi:hypothetical protein
MQWNMMCNKSNCATQRSKGVVIREDAWLTTDGEKREVLIEGFVVDRGGMGGEGNGREKKGVGEWILDEFESQKQRDDSARRQKRLKK